MKKNSDHCPFCEIATDDAAGRIILQNHRGFAIRDGYPVSEGHCLIIPKRHVASFFDTDKKERQALLDLLDQARELLDKKHNPAAYNIGVNDGPAAGQTIFHCHIHIIPRYENDRADPRGGVRWVNPEKADYWSKRDA